jgi:hypothetical protein
MRVQLPSGGLRVVATSYVERQESSRRRLHFGSSGFTDLRRSEAGSGVELRFRRERRRKAPVATGTLAEERSLGMALNR